VPFLAAARDGDFEKLLELLDPDVVLRARLGPLAGGLREVRGAAEVARQALAYSRIGLVMQRRGRGSSFPCSCRRATPIRRRSCCRRR